MALLRPTDRLLERIYVWELPVRLTHWAIFFSTIALALTGYYIGNPFLSSPGPASGHFFMAYARVIHTYASIVFSLAVLIRVYWMFAGNEFARLTEFVPLSRRRLRNLGQSALFYAYIRRDPVAYPGHSALAGGSYVMIFAIYFVMILTGLALYSVGAQVGSPLRFFEVLIPVFHSLPIARLIHHAGMWFLIMFVVVHLYFVLLSSLTERAGTFDSIFSGYKFFPKRREDVE